jgi:hypothetical protein
LEEILNASLGDELLDAMTEAMVEIKTLPDTPIIIDRVDKLGKEGTIFLKKFCALIEAVSPSIKVLVTYQSDPSIQELVLGVPCIKYNGE